MPSLIQGLRIWHCYNTVFAVLWFIKFKTLIEDTSLKWSSSFFLLYQSPNIPPLHTHTLTHTHAEWWNPIYVSPEMYLRDVPFFPSSLPSDLYQTHLNNHGNFLTCSLAPRPPPFCHSWPQEIPMLQNTKDITLMVPQPNLKIFHSTPMLIQCPVLSMEFRPNFYVPVLMSS